MAEYKMKGWVAQDSESMSDTNLYFGTLKPRRTLGGWFWYCFEDHLGLPKEMFPNLKWEDEPLKVELTIKECKDENNEN